MAAPAISGILTFIAGIFAMLGSNPPFAGTATGVFFEAVSVFIAAVTVYLLAQGWITMQKRR
jgi:hypothetical protein